MCQYRNNQGNYNNNKIFYGFPNKQHNNNCQIIINKPFNQTIIIIQAIILVNINKVFKQEHQLNKLIKNNL